MFQLYNNGNSTPHNLKQGQVARSHVVIVDFDVDPAGLLRGFFEGHAFAMVVDLIHREKLLCGGVDAAVELPSKQVNSHDAEYQPEDQTHQQHVEDGGNCSDKSVHHHLPKRKVLVRIKELWRNT